MLNVLYVDDEQINLDLFEMAFRKEFKVYKAISAEKGLDLLNGNLMDVIISDFKMPGMDGIQFIHKVKNQFPALNCILLTGYYEPGLVNDPHVQSILFKYVLKPFKKDEMRGLIVDAAKPSDN